MGTTDPPAPRTAATTGRRQRLLNAVVRTLLRSPLHGLVSGRLLIITVTGRSTGIRYELPVGYVEHDGALLVGTAGRWRHNLNDHDPVRVRYRGRDRPADSEVITDEATIVPLYRAILRHNPIHGRFAGIRTDPDGNPYPSDLRDALRRGCAVVRLRPR
jgi:deazaflavin-dependent oxidoreductase (nitroreductase family)